MGWALPFERPSLDAAHSILAHVEVAGEPRNGDRPGKCSVLKHICSERRMLEAILKSGMFPSQLPPCFTTEPFAAYCAATPAVIPQVPASTKKNTSAEKFSVARAGHFRRPTAIVNPQQYFHLAKIISDNEAFLWAFMATSSLSASKPTAIPGGGRSITIAATRELSEKKLLLASGYKYSLTTDIAQFFPSIYTHSLSWALYGKAAVKASLAIKGSLKTLGDKLDEAMRHLQSNQTIGIPIGPDASHIFAELIACAVDVKLKAALPNLVGFRYVDDYVFFFDDIKHAEACLAVLTKSLSEYELNLNAAKTHIEAITGISSDHWTHELKAFNLSDKRLGQKRDINHFFDLANFLANKNSDENVMKFALRKLAANLINPDNWKAAEAHLLRAAIVFPNTIIDVARFLYTYSKNGYSINSAAVEKTINTILSEHAPLEHHSEVAWALWIAIGMNIQIDPSVAKTVSLMRSSPCHILIFELQRRGMCSMIDNSLLVERNNSDDLYGDMWLAVYETRVQGLFTPPADLLKGTFFGSLRDAGVKFFDLNRVPKPFFSFKPGTDINSVFHADGTYADADVEFDEIPEEYADEVDEDVDFASAVEEKEEIDDDENPFYL